MNILYVATNEYFPYPHAGSTHIYNICRNIREHGNRVVILARKMGIDDNTVYDGMNIYYTPRTFFDMLLSIRALKKIIWICKEYRIDIIHERHSFPGGAGVLAGYLLGIPSILEINSPLAEEIYPFPFYDIVQLNTKLQEKIAKRLITQTPILKNILEKNTKTEIDVIPNGADPDAFKHVSKRRRLQLKKQLGLKGRVVTYIGRFTPWHGADDLIMAFSDIEDASLLLIGSGGDINKCKSLAEGLNNVVFTGSVKYEKIHEYLSISDIFVAPFTLKGKRKGRFMKYGFWWSPVKIFEYMAAGKPVIAADLGMVPKYINGAGLVYEHGNIEDLRNKINFLLENPGLCCRLGKRGRNNIIKNYSWDIQAKKTIVSYKKILYNS